MMGESRDFEYDEDTEAGDESAEGDESFEAADESSEGDESFEADEDAGEGDEAFEAAGDAGEAIDEGDGEGDEADEAFDAGVSMSASARLRADQDRNRRAEWARQIAADQRLEAQRAATTQRGITDQIRSIQPGGRARLYSVGSLQGAGVVTAILPNGRRSRMRIIPTMAPIGEVNRLRSVILVNEKRQATATVNNSRAITALAVAQAGAVKKLTAEQVKSDKDLRKRLVEGDNRLDRRITKTLSGGSGSLDKHGKRMMRILRRNRQRAIMNSVTLATAMPFFAAYGDRSNPFSKTNLILTGSLAGWLVADEIADQFAGKSGVVKGGASLWSYLAPVGNGATAYFLFRNKQNQRFVSGVTPVDGLKGAKVDLTAAIGKKSVDEFKSADHTAVATILDPAAPVAGVAARDVRAVVGRDGILLLSVDAGAAGTVNVAWIVDTSPAPTVKPVATIVP